MKVSHDHTARIKSAETRLQESPPTEERTRLLSQIGHWHEEMGHLEEARRSLEVSLALVPGQYWTVKQLLGTLKKLGDKNGTLELMTKLLRLDPHNPTVFDDCITHARGSSVNWSDLLDLLEALRTNYPDDQLVQANCDFYACNLLMGTDPVSARKHLAAAQQSFRKLFPRGHQVFVALRSALRQLAQSKRATPPSSET